jgi:hypothetical protein
MITESLRLDAMDYLSPLVDSTPDLRPHFKHIWGRHQPSSLGHVVYSDWADKNAEDDPTGFHRETGFWTRDEAAILYHCAKQVKGLWLDIGAYTGWTAAHAAAAGARVVALDTLFKYKSFRDRFRDNIVTPFGVDLCGVRSWCWSINQVTTVGDFHGIVIDGNHNWGAPLKDAQYAEAHTERRAVVLFHDFIGGPVQEGVNWLIDHGFKCRIYATPHMVACCWRG